jgi:uncharacterized protein (UPF0335 family)
MIDSQQENEADGTRVETDEEVVKQVYAFAANLLFEEKQNKKEVINALITHGIDAEWAKTVVSNLLSSKNERARKDMIYGLLWCIGGAIATVADIGYIFWGAIIFGGLQFLKGLFSYRWK